MSPLFLIPLCFFCLLKFGSFFYQFLCISVLCLCPCIYFYFFFPYLSFILFVFVSFMCPYSTAHGMASCAPRISVFETILQILLKGKKKIKIKTLIVFGKFQFFPFSFCLFLVYCQFFGLFFIIICPLLCLFLVQLCALILAQMGHYHVRQELVILKQY